MVMQKRVHHTVWRLVSISGTVGPWSASTHRHLAIGTAHWRVSPRLRTLPRFLCGWWIRCVNSFQRIFFAIVVFSATQKPYTLVDWTTPTWPEEGLKNYLESSYLLDPYYRAGIEKRAAGLYRMEDVAPPGIKESEYYLTYYANSPIADELGYLIYLDDEYFANVAFNRNSDSPPFSDDEVELLRQCYEMVEETLLNYWGRTAYLRRGSGSKVYSHLESALGVFGDSVLTPREAEIMRLYLYGHDTKSIAEKLEISSHTVSVHRKNAYARLDVTSQAELFSLFINSMYCFQGDMVVDPLETFLAGPNQDQ